MYNIAIIGMGALGKRHLEALLKAEMKLSLYIVDNNRLAVEDIMAGNKKDIVCGGSVDVLPKCIDVAIIATPSAVRKEVFKSLITHSVVKNIIFEKVLFQTKEDYYEAERLLREKNIRAWVNCARRECDSYWKIREMLKDSKSFTVNITGGEWGLGCNGIHMLDLVEFLDGREKEKCIIHEANILPVIKESKRKGYKEVYGTISGSCGRCELFALSCFRDSKLPMHIEIAADNFKCIIAEGKRKFILMHQKNEWKAEEMDFEILFQSQLTHKVVENILKNGQCRLPDYHDSMKLHLTYIEPLIKFFEECGMEKGICPIT